MADNKSFMKSLQAYEKIRDMILSGVKLPGTRLVLSELEAELRHWSRSHTRSPHAP